jgi:hypothetical protein
MVLLNQPEPPLRFPSVPTAPPPAPVRGLIDAPRIITCALCDLSCAPTSSVFDSVMHEPPPAPVSGLTAAPRIITCALCDFSCAPNSSVFDCVMHDRVRCGAAEPTGALPPPAPVRGLTDAPRIITCALCDFSCAPNSSVFDSVMHARVHCGAAEPTGAPLPLPECPRWPSTALECGLFDAPRLIAYALSDFSRSPESSVFGSVIHEGVRSGAAEPTGAPLPLSECPRWPSAAPERGLFDAPRVIACALNDFSRSPE